MTTLTETAEVVDYGGAQDIISHGSCTPCSDPQREKHRKKRPDKKNKKK